MEKLIKIYQCTEEWVLGAMLFTMILLACTQIAMRLFFSSGFLWIDPFLRYLVLWSGLLGATMATSRGQHIALDLVGFLVTGKVKAWLKLFTLIFSAIVAGFLSWAAFRFIQDEYLYGGPSLLELPSWAWNIIFPLAFTLITIHFLLAAIGAIINILKPQKVGAE